MGLTQPEFTLASGCAKTDLYAYFNATILCQKDKLGNILSKYTQFIFEWPILSDRFWVLVYILRKNSDQKSLFLKK